MCIAKISGARTTVLRAVKVRWRLKGLVVELPGQGTAVGRAGRSRIGGRR